MARLGTGERYRGLVAPQISKTMARDPGTISFSKENFSELIARIKRYRRHEPQMRFDDSDSILSNSIKDTGVLKQITSAQARELFNCAATCSSIRKIEIEDSNVGDEGALVCANFLRQNKTLTWLRMARNNITGQGVQAIQQVLGLEWETFFISFVILFSGLNFSLHNILLQALMENFTILRLEVEEDENREFNPLLSQRTFDVNSYKGEIHRLTMANIYMKKVSAISPFSGGTQFVTSLFFFSSLATASIFIKLVQCRFLALRLLRSSTES